MKATVRYPIVKNRGGGNVLQKLFSFFKVAMLVLVLLNFSGCLVPVYLPKARQADTQPEYRTKYFSVIPPQGRWITKISGPPSFMVPLEGNILAEVTRDKIEFWSVPKGTYLYPLKHSVDLTISSCPIPEPIPDLAEVKIGDKTLYKLKGELDLCYFTPHRAYEFGGFYIWNRDGLKMDSELLRVIESFEPLEFKASKEALLLEKALILSRSGGIGCSYGKLYTFEEITKAYQNVIEENPNNYIAHLFLGRHYSDDNPSHNFYKTIILPKIVKNPKEIDIRKWKRVGDAKQVLTKNMEQFDLYRDNMIWIVNKKDFYSFFLHGDFDYRAATAEFKKALEIKPDSYAARYYLSWLYLRSGEYEKAALEYKTLLEKDPQDADALLMLSVAYKAMGLEKEAKEFYDALKKTKQTGTLYEFLDKFVGPSLTDSLGAGVEAARR